MVASLEITQLEQEAMTIPKVADNASSTLRSISNTLVDHDMCWCMCEKERDGHFVASIGSTNTLTS